MKRMRSFPMMVEGHSLTLAFIFIYTTSSESSGETVRMHRFVCAKACTDRERGGGGGQGSRHPIPLKNHKNIGFLNNTGPDPLKITKLPSQHSMLGHHRHASETPFKWRFCWRIQDGPLTVVFGFSISPHQLKNENKKTNVVKLSGSAHEKYYSLVMVSFENHEEFGVLGSVLILSVKFTITSELRTLKLIPQIKVVILLFTQK